MAKDKKGDKKGTKGVAKKGSEQSDIETIMKRFLKTYEKNCAISESRMNPHIRASLMHGIANESLVFKFVFQHVPKDSDADLPVLLAPFITSIRNERYIHIKDLHIWDYPMTWESTVLVANLMEQATYSLRILELMDCIMSPQTVERLARPFRKCQYLTTLNLDYNEFGDAGCANLCAGLAGNRTMLSLSLCYCDLGIESGRTLGDTVAKTAIRELYIDGNNLECEGAIELIKLFVDQADLEAFQRAEEARHKAEEEARLKAEAERAKEQRFYTDSSDGERPKTDATKGKKKKKGKKGKKKKEPPGPPPVGPWIHRLHMADNGIDEKDAEPFNNIVCMRLFQKLVSNSSVLEELDLEDNLIGEMGGRELLDGLVLRSNAGLGGIKLRCTHRMTTETFNAIVKQASGLKKKKKKGKGKKKKK